MCVCVCVCVCVAKEGITKCMRPCHSPHAITKMTEHVHRTCAHGSQAMGEEAMNV